MPSENLERLVQKNALSRHRPSRREIESHLAVARDFAKAAAQKGLPEIARFNNLYEAAHSASLAWLKLAGYRSKEGEGNGPLTLSVVEQTLALRQGTAAAFVEANRLRALMHDQGDDVDPTEALLEILERGVQEALKEIPARLKAAKLE